MATFSERLKEAMDRRELKQSDVVRLSGLDKSLIHNYLAGKYKAKDENMRILANILYVSEDWLKGCDVPMQINNQFDANSTQQLNELIEFFNSLTPEARGHLIALIKAMQSKE